MASIKIRAKASGDVITVKAIMSHPMQREGQRDKKTGEEIPAHYITDVIAEHNGVTVMTANWSGGISKNPYIAFKFKGGKTGETIKISWTDIQGKTDSAVAKIK